MTIQTRRQDGRGSKIEELEEASVRNVEYHQDLIVHHFFAE